MAGVSNAVILERLENLIKSHEEDKKYTHDALEGIKKDLNDNNDMTRYHDKILIKGNGYPPLIQQVKDLKQYRREHENLTTKKELTLKILFYAVILNFIVLISFIGFEESIKKMIGFIK